MTFIFSSFRFWLHSALLQTKINMMQVVLHTINVDLERMSCSAPPNGCKDTTSRLEKTMGGAFQWEPGGWEAKACTSPGAMLRYFWGLCMFKFSSRRMISVAD
jgi:hypothetical protein